MFLEKAALSVEQCPWNTLPCPVLTLILTKFNVWNAMFHVCAILYNLLILLMIGRGNDGVKVLKEMVGFYEAILWSSEGPFYGAVSCWA